MLRVHENQHFSHGFEDEELKFTIFKLEMAGKHQKGFENYLLFFDKKVQISSGGLNHPEEIRTFFIEEKKVK